MPATKYIRFIFGVSGDLAPVPDVPPGDGSMSYQQGFTLNYQLPNTDSAKLDVPRNQTNQLYNDLSANIQQYQQIGAPNLIEAVQNGGLAFTYEKYAIVRYDDGLHGPRTFMSKSASNNTLPNDTSKWWYLDNTAGAAVIDDAVFDVAVLNRDAVYWDSGSSTFKRALANGATPQNVVGFADVTYKRVYLGGYVNFLTGLTPGQKYYLSTVTAGAITTIRPTSNIVKMGFSKSSTEMFLNIQDDPSDRAVVARVLMSSDQAISSGSSIKVNFDTVDFDDFSLWNAIDKRFDLSIPGNYTINSCYISANLPLSTTCGLNVHKNGVFDRRVSEHYASSLSDFGPSGSCLIRSNGSDYAEIFATAGAAGFTIAGATPGYALFEITYEGS